MSVYLHRWRDRFLRGEESPRFFILYATRRGVHPVCCKRCLESLEGLTLLHRFLSGCTRKKKRSRPVVCSSSRHAGTRRQAVGPVGPFN